MPFDGVLLASRVMVAKEALTADSAKDLIVATPGYFATFVFPLAAYLLCYVGYQKSQIGHEAMKVK